MMNCVEELMKKKLIAMLLTLAIALSLLAGCGSVGVVQKPTDGGNVQVGPTDSTKSYITVATWDGGLGSQWLKDAAELFEEMHKDTSFEEGKKGIDIEVIASRSFDGSAMAYTPLAHDIYFVEAVDYYAMYYNDQLADITDVITQPLSDYGDDKTILEKIDPAIEAILNMDDHYYAIPFYESFYSFAYDLDLWDEKSFYMSASGGWTDSEGDLSAGPDGENGTGDDGLPATFEDFGKLITRIKDAGVLPFVCAANAQDYVANLLYEYWANYEGLEQMMLNYEFEGTATDLINVDADGNITKLPETEISFENGYELQQQAGRYYALKFCKDILLSSEENYKIYDTHINTQKVFVKGGITNDTPVAMIIEGSWWENEAKASLEELVASGYDRHNYAVMPMPHATADKIGQKQTWLAMSESYGLIPSSCDSLEPAKEFMRYLHTDERLSAFTGETNMTRALNYELLDRDAATISTYAKSILALKENGNVIYPYSSIPEVLDNDPLFGAFSWAWLSNINGLEYKSPWIYFLESKGGTPEEYFAGQKKLFETKWVSFS